METAPRIDSEFKALIPPLTGEEYLQLEQNILAAGKCRDAIVLWDGVIVDGHNRFEICVAHGIEFRVEERLFASKEDAKVWIIENQLGRRNLNDASRIELALQKAELLKERARKNLAHGGRPAKDGEKKGLPKTSKLPGEPLHVQKALAAEAGVSKGTLCNYMQIKDAGNPELLEKVKTGGMKIGTAHKMLPKEIEKQLDRVDKMYAYIEERLPFECEETNALVHEKLSELTLLLKEVIDNA